MNKRYYISLWITLVAFLFSSALTAHAQDVDFVTEVTSGNGEGTYEVEFLGVTNNSDGTHTWRYRVTEVSGKDLSNWILELCPEAYDDLKDTDNYSPTTGAEFVSGNNANSDLTGIKWNVGDDFESGVFAFTLSEEYALDQSAVGVEIKTGGKGDKTGDSEIAGPDCESSGVCSVTVLGEDIVDQDAKTVTNTLSDPEGIATLDFVKLEGFEVASLPGFVSADGTTWTWQGDAGTEPKDVQFVLKATASEAVYFLKVTNGCGTEGYIDPPYDFSDALGGAFTLDGSYPNPFSARTEIAFELSEAAHTTLTVYDVMGRKVATLVDRSMDAGPHAVAWNGHSDQGSKLASGVYFYRLSAGDVSQTKRVIIVR